MAEAPLDHRALRQQAPGMMIAMAATRTTTTSAAGAAGEAVR